LLIVELPIARKCGISPVISGSKVTHHESIFEPVGVPPITFLTYRLSPADTAVERLVDAKPVPLFKVTAVKSVPAAFKLTSN
jgi:hypothetical protein